jgi:DNA-binding CsgD family transcriptional regulator
MKSGKLPDYRNFDFPKNNIPIKELLLRRAKERGNSLRWNANTLILSYTILAPTIILSLRSVNIAVLALAAVTRLTVIWGFSYYQARKMERSLLKDELKIYMDLLSSRRAGENPQGAADKLPAAGQTESPLTERELQVLALLGEGRSNKETAATLQISDQTVKNHISHIFAKLGVNDRTSAVLMAISNGWIQNSDSERSKSPLDKNH